MLSAVAKRTLFHLTLLVQSVSLAQGQFTPTGPIAVGAGPQSIATADLNNDGHPDLITANFRANTVTVLLNNGDGTFTEAPGSPILVGTGPGSVAIADFNGDGWPDIVTANFQANSVTVLLNIGEGLFTEAPGNSFTAGSLPTSVAIGDFNGDGKPDFVTANSADNTITIFLGNGSGGFVLAPGSPISVGLSPQFVAVGDLNADGHQDLVTANARDNTVTILLGNGDGGFSPSPRSTVGVGASPVFIAITDRHILTVNTADNTLTELLDAGAGGFAAATNGPMPLGASPRSLAIADFNGDGISDIVAVNSADNSIALLPGHGHAGFTIATGTTSVSAAVADFNGDGEPDLAVANAGDNTVTIYLNSLPAIVPKPYSLTFYAAAKGPAPASIPVNLTSATPGFTYRVSANRWLASTPLSQATGAVTVVNLSPSASLTPGLHTGTIRYTAPDFFGAATAFNLSVAAPSGTLQPAAGSPFGAGASPQSVATADLNGDTFPDLVTANYGGNTVSVLLGDGTGAFTAASGSPFAVGVNPISVAIADFNGDGKPDLVTANADSNSVSVLLGDGAGGFTVASGSPFAVGGEPQAVAVGDFNADGNPDILAANNSDQTVTVLLGNGTGGFAPARGSPVALGSAPQTIAVGDFNGDGKPDFVTAAYNNKVTILYGSGGGGFAGARPFAVGSFPQFVAAADLNGDGKLDIVTANSGSNSVTVLLANSAGGYTAAAGSPFTVGMIPQSVALVDINGDGKPDIVAANAGDNTISVLTGNGAGGFAAAAGSPFAAGATPFSLAAGDFNGDGRADLAITDVGGGAVTVLLGSRAPTSSALTTTAGATVVYGTSVPLTLRVTSMGFSSPTGAVMFLDATTALGTATQTTTPYLFSVTGLDAGAHSLTASYGGDTASLASVSAALSLAITPAPQAITFGALSNKVFGAAPFPVSSTASSALAVSFASNSPSVCTVSGGTVTLVSVGMCIVEASQLGDLDHLAAAPVDQKFMVTQASQTIAFGALPNVVIGTAPFLLTATASSGLTVNFASTTATVCTVSGGTVTLASAGNCTIQATQPGNTNYAAATPVSQHFSVTPTTQTIAFAALSNQVFGTAAPALSATATSGLAVTFASTTASVCTVSGTAMTLASVGTCTVQASQAGNSSYAAAASVSQSFRVSQGSQTIAFGALANKVFGSTPFAVSATATSGLPVSFASATSPVCTVSGANVTLVSAGSCAIQALQTGNNNYAAATAVTQSFTVSQASQTITFARLPNKALGSAPFTVTATASSALAVSFASLTMPVCTVSGATVALVSAGTCTLEATQTGNANYTAATPVDQNLTVTPGTQTITFGPLSNLSMGSAPFALSATASSGLPVAFASNTPAICTVSSASVTLVSVGSCTVQATQPGDTNYAAAAAVSQSFQVTPQSQTIAFGVLANQIVGSAPVPLSAIATSGLTVAFTSVTLAVCTISGGSVTLVSIGTCTIQAAQPGNATYAAAAPVGQSFTVLPSGQTITFNPLASQALGSPPFALVATASSGLRVIFMSATSAVCTVSGLNVTLVSVGVCTVQATQPGNASYAAAPSVSQQFSVTAAPQTIAFNALANRVYGAAPFAVSATASSGLPVSFASITPPVCTVSASMVTPVGAGTCTVEASQSGNVSYAAAAPVDQSLTIAPGAQTITFGPLANKVFGASPMVSATASSGLAVTFASNTLPVCTVSGMAVTLVSTGTCTLEASQSGNSNYAAAPPVDQSFTIAAGSQTIVFGAIANQPFGPAPLSIAATASSGLAVTLTSSASSVCTVSGSAVTLAALGLCTIQATQPGNASYAAAPSVSQSFTVTQGSQTIAFAAPPNQPFGAAPVTLNATASSGLSPILTSATSSVCTVSGMAATLLSLGVCTVKASQPGNANYAAATPLSQSFTVTQASQTIAFSPIPNQPFTSAPVALSATASSGLAVVLSSSSPAVCSISGAGASLAGAGVCTVQATQPGNATYAPATAVSQSFTVAQGIQTITFGAPSNQLLGTAPFMLTATASSGLGVAFSSNTPPVCTVSGAIVTVVGAGVCTIQAAQPGNATYAAATPVLASFTVGAAAVLNSVLNAASYSMSSLATDGYTVIFGSNFSATSIQANPLTLPATLAGASVTITDSLGLTLSSPLYYVSPTQINFVVPEGLAPGSATLTVVSFVGSKATLPVTIAAVAPALFTADASGNGVPAAIAFDYDANGATQAPPVFACVGVPAVCTPDPISLGLASTSVYLALFGTGIRGRSGLSGVSVMLGTVALQVSYAGAQSTYPGLDQINVLIDRALSGRGLLTLQLKVDGVAANPVTVDIQ